MALTTDIQVTMSNQHTKALDLSTPTDVLPVTKQFSWTSGTGDDQADIQWHDQRTVTDGSDDDIDLVGALSDAFGDTFSPARIKAIWIENLNTQEELHIGPGAVSNPFTSWIAGTQPYIILPPGGGILLVAPKATAWVCTAGTADILRITNPSIADVDVTYNIVVIGASA